jgi:hypothetical protein
MRVISVRFYAVANSLALEVYCSLYCMGGRLMSSREGVCMAVVRDRGDRNEFNDSRQLSIEA